MKPTQNQKKEMLEWCGADIYAGLFTFRNGEGSWSVASWEPSLNWLFRFAVPRLNNDYYIDIMNYRDKWQARVQSKSGLVGSKEVHKDPALALFWAIKKVQEVR